MVKSPWKTLGIVAVILLLLVLVVVVVNFQNKAALRQELKGYVKTGDLPDTSKFALKSEIPEEPTPVDLSPYLKKDSATQTTTLVTVGVVTPTVSGWEELPEEFHPAKDDQDIVNVDHIGKPRITIAWFYAAGGTKAPADGCTVHVVSAPDGERITFRGAMRTWEWTGSSAPTKEQIHQLVTDWIKVLEKEPRGACAKDGVYTVTWQDPKLVPANATGRP